MKNIKVTLCLEALFNRLADCSDETRVLTQYGCIEKETDGDNVWFDFKNNFCIPYMDGEICELIEETEQYVVLQEIDEQIPFKLSKKEFEIAAKPVLFTGNGFRSFIMNRFMKKV